MSFEEASPRPRGLFGPAQGSLTPETIAVGMRVAVHYRLSEDATGTVLEVDEPWALIRFDGYEGRLRERALIAEMDELHDAGTEVLP